MEKTFFTLLRTFFLFGRNLIGCFNDPYVTYRRLLKEKTGVLQTLYIFLPVILYFLFVSMIRTGIHHPIILTLQLNSLLLTSFLGFAGMVLFIYFFGRISGNKKNLKSIFILWSYSLIPTLVWFIATSLLYLLFPPPRTLSMQGKIYSIIFIAFSLSVLFWKLILYYLTLRFAIKADLKRIIFISIILVPLIISFALITYQWKIFRIPFI